MSEAPQAILRVTVTDRGDVSHEFASTGLHEDYEFTVNGYTGELTVDRVEYGPRGADAWARRSSTVVAAWPAEGWASVTQHNPLAR